MIGIEASHDLAAAAKGAHRIPTADQLAQGGQIGPHPFLLLQTAAAETKGDDLVEDQEDLVPIGQLAHAQEVSRLRIDQAAGAQHRLHDDSGDPVVVLFEDRLRGLEIIERGDEKILGDAGRHPALQTDRGKPFGREVGNGVGLHEIMDSVVAAVHLDEAVLAGEGAGGAHGEQRGLRSRVAVANQVQRGDAVAQMSSVLVLDDRGSGEGRALLRLGPGRLDQARVGVAVDQGGEVVDQVNVLVPIAIVDATPLASLHEDGIWAVVGSRARVSTGQVFLGRLEVLPRLCGPLEIALRDLPLDALSTPSGHGDLLSMASALPKYTPSRPSGRPGPSLPSTRRSKLAHFRIRRS